MKVKKKQNKTNYGTVSLPLPLIKKIKEKMNGTGMNSVSAYVAFILRQILSSPSKKNENSIFSTEEEEIIKERLRKLGYL